MRFLLDNWYLILTALVSGGLLLWPVIRGGAGGGGGVSTAEAVRLINREKGVLIDVREPSEFAAGHAVGARNVPLSQLETATTLPANKALPLLVLCATGSRAGRAVALLKKRGYENTQVVAGGLAAWREANLPTETAA